MRDATDPSHQLAVTIGHGLPFTWVECTKVMPTITVEAATFFDDQGKPLPLPLTRPAAANGPGRAGQPVHCPATVTMKDTDTQQFAAQAYDQYGALLAVTPVWGVVGKGSISATGLYTPSGGGLYQQPTFTVMATVGGSNSQATVIVEETPKLATLDIQPHSSAAQHLEIPLGAAQQLTYLAQSQFGVTFDGPLP